MIDCPSAATLSRILLDSHEGDTFDEVDSHVEGCSECRELLDQLQCNDRESSGGEFPPDHSHPDIRGFEILKVLGRGGMGVVYLARQKNTDRLVALKIVRSGPEAGSRERERWLREARAFSKVRHENVVTLFEFGESDGWLYLVLDFIPGGTVEETLKVPYAAKDAAQLVLSVAQAVSAIHAAGLLHLDLKPSNIFLDGPEGMSRELAKPRVGDLGIARHWNETGASFATASIGGPIGSPSHMAPEQIVSERSKLGPASDVYGLGAVLYHVLTGRAPFAAPSTIETLDQVRNVEPVPPRRLNPKIPRDLETICLKCLDKDPRRRYQTAETVADDLRRWLDGRPIQARRASVIGRCWKLCRRRPGIVSLLALLTTTLSVGITGMFILWRRAESARAQAESEKTIAASAQKRAESEKVMAQESESRAREVTQKLLATINNALLSSVSPDVRADHLLVAIKLMRSNLPRWSRTESAGHGEMHSLGITGMFIAQFLEDLGRKREAEELVRDSGVLFKDCLLKHGNEDYDLGHCGWSLLRRGKLVLADKRVVEALALHGEMARLTPLIADDKLRRDHIRYMSDQLIAGSNDLWASGEMIAAIRVITEDLRLLDLQRPVDMSLPVFIELSERVQVLRGQRQKDIEAMEREVLARKAAEERDIRERKIAEEVSRKFLITYGLDSGDPSPSAWCERVMEAVRCRSHQLSADAMSTTHYGWVLVGNYAGDLVQLRREGKISDAERGAQRLLTLSQGFVKEFPRSHKAWLILDEAYLQLAKNAFRRDDTAAVKRWTQESFEAASRALELEPNSHQAQIRTENRRQRLARRAEE